MVPTKEQIGQRLHAYAMAISARLLLMEHQAGHHVTWTRGQELVAEENRSDSPNIIQVIQKIITNPDVVKMKTSCNIFAADGWQLFQAKISGKAKIEIVNQYCQAPNGLIVPEAVNQVFDFHGDEEPILLASAQVEVIRKCAEAIKAGNANQLAIMGIGTGKSLVIAGIATAVGQGIYIVPNDILADELHKNSISKLKPGTEMLFARNLSVNEISSALKTGTPLIFTANDPNFSLKANKVKGAVVLAYESHQQGFSDLDIQLLSELKADNMIIAVTDNPMSALQELFQNQLLVDMNLRKFMNAGALRCIHPFEKNHVAKKELVNELIKGYFGRDAYLTSGIGYTDPRDLVRGGQKPEEAIEVALIRNKIRCLDQKNFLFSGEVAFQKHVLAIYDQIANGSYDPVALASLEAHIRVMRAQAEIEARVQLMSLLDPNESTERLKKLATDKVGEGHAVDVQSEVRLARKTQLAQAINAKALELLLGIPDYVFAAKMRTHTLAGFLHEHKDDVLANPIHKDEPRLKNYLNALPEVQRRPYIRLLVSTANTIRNKKLAGLLQPAAVDLDALHAEYTANAYLNMSKADETRILDQLKAGLVMHVGSDRIFATDIAVRDVLSTQQAVLDQKDSLNQVMLTSQLHARTLGDTDRWALNQQVVAVGVRHFFKLSSVIAEDANYRAAEHYQREIVLNEEQGVVKDEPDILMKTSKI